MKFQTKPPRGERGVAMVSAVVTVFSAGAMVAVLLTLATARDKEANLRRDEVEARYLAEGAAQVGKRFLQEGIANWQIPIDQTLPAGTVVYAEEVPIDGEAASYVVSTTGFGNTLVDPAGVQTILQGYQIQGAGQAGLVDGRVDYIVSALATPIFQFAVFYTSDLEINPGPEMELLGRVHTNGNMYLSPGDLLTMATNYVHAVGDIYRHRKDKPNESKGQVDIAKWVENPFAESLVFEEMLGIAGMDDLGITGTTGYDSNFTDGYDANGDGDFDDANDLLPFVAGSLDLWGNEVGYGAEGYTVLTGDHGLGEAVTPAVESIHAYEAVDGGGTHAYDPDTGTYELDPSGNGTHNKGFYHSQAAFSVIMNEAQTDYSVYGPNGSDSDGFGIPWKQTFEANGVTSLVDFYDAKQAEAGSGSVNVVQWDMAAFNTLVEPQIDPVSGVESPPVIDMSGAPNDNGGMVLFAGGVNLQKGLDAGGLLVKNAADLPQAPALGGNGGLTVVGESSVYLQGDYNVDGKVGAAVIADGVNLLSNDWDGSKQYGSGIPKASETTYNVAMISGNYPTVEGKYNGGLENLPRFHENWGGIDCNITGSFVNAWESQIATAPWKYGSPYYTAPNRNWQYDSDYNNIANLPPFTPMVVEAVDVAVW